MPDWIEELGETGLAVRQGFLGHATALAARSEAAELVRAGLVFPRGVSRGASYRVDRSQRGDDAGWLTPEACGPALGELLRRMEALQDELRERAFLPLRRREVQLARYAGGARYVRHRDAFPGVPGRVITAVHYLTDDGWDAGTDGGALLVHLPAGTVTVEPLLDRLVIFRSELEHEVLPAFRERMAVTCWFIGPEVLPP